MIYPENLNASLEKRVNKITHRRLLQIIKRKEDFIDQLCKFLLNIIVKNRQKYQDIILHKAKFSDNLQEGVTFAIWNNFYFLDLFVPSFIYYEKYADSWLEEALKMFSENYLSNIKDLLDYSNIEIEIVNYEEIIYVYLHINFNVIKI